MKKEFYAVSILLVFLLGISLAPVICESQDPIILTFSYYAKPLDTQITNGLGVKATIVIYQRHFGVHERDYSMNNPLYNGQINIQDRFSGPNNWAEGGLAAWYDSSGTWHVELYMSVMDNGVQRTIKQEEVHNFGAYKIEILRQESGPPGSTQIIPDQNTRIWVMYVMRPGSSTWEAWGQYVFYATWIGANAQTEMEGNLEPASGQLNCRVDDFSNMGWLYAVGSWYQWNPTGQQTNFQYIVVVTGTALWYPKITH